MIIQCVDCLKKYRLKADGPPPDGRAVRCPSCNRPLPVVLRDNAEPDRTGADVAKPETPDQARWNQKVAGVIGSWGYARGTAEMNLLFLLFQKLRKMFGVAYVPSRIKPELARVERELDYNVLTISSEHCLPLPDASNESQLRKMILGLWNALSIGDSAKRFTLRKILGQPFPDSFPAVFRFIGTVYNGPDLPPRVWSEATLSVDALRKITPDFELQRLPEVGRLALGDTIRQGANLGFAERIRPGLFLPKGTPVDAVENELVWFWQT